MTPEQKRERHRAWRKANPEKYLAGAARYRAKNREKILAAAKLRHAQNRAIDNERSRAGREARIAADPSYESKAARHKRYGLTPAEYANMHAAQQGRCAICRTPVAAQARTTHVDHDHATGRVRGILCQRCNIGLGFIERAEWLAQVRDYIVRNGSRLP